MAGGAPWPEVSLGDHVDLLSGFPFKSARYTDKPEDLRLLRGDNVAQGYLRWNGAKRWPAGEQEEYAKFKVQEGDVILAMDRPWIEAGLKWGWIRSNDLPSLLVQRVSRLRGANGLLSEYLRYLIGSQSFSDYIQPIVTGVNVPHISATQIKDFRFHLPPLEQQREITSILSAYDDLIENNTRRITILEEMARALYHEWFVHFRFPGHETVPLVDSPVGPIPEGWEPRRLEDIAREWRRSLKPEDLEAATPYVGLEHIPRRSIALAEWGSADGVQSTKLAFKKGEILFGKIRPYFHKVSVAPLDGVCSSDAIVISPLEERWWAMTLMCASSDPFVAEAVQTSNGTKMPRANWAVLLRYATPTPPEDLLERFNGFLRTAVDQIYTLIAKNKNLRTTRDLLLPKLISGEIDVSKRHDDVAEAAD